MHLPLPSLSSLPLIPFPFSNNSPSTCKSLPCLQIPLERKHAILMLISLNMISTNQIILSPVTQILYGRRHCYHSLTFWDIFVLFHIIFFLRQGCPMQPRLAYNSQLSCLHLLGQYQDYRGKPTSPFKHTPLLDVLSQFSSFGCSFSSACSLNVYLSLSLFLFYSTVS